MRKWEVLVKLSVADSWVADGFDAKEYSEELIGAVKELLPHSYDYEVDVHLVFKKWPADSIISGLRNGLVKIKD